ncbi:MAG: flippase-like domain-containing protein [Candidatus Methanofastidiosa archaeon]|jgi:uncharacterized protein (TIRG00374 family)|nr:flippase-like domain-containing protein [Candidatus Methanofastidiosa archaeon]
MTRGRILKTLAAFCFGLLIILLLVRDVGFDQAYAALKRANGYYVLVAIAMSLISIYIGGIRWKHIITDPDVEVSYRQLFLSLLSGNFVNNITPAGKGGGEPLRAYLLSKLTGIDAGKVFATVISDRIFDTFPYVLLGYFGVFSLVLFWEVDRIVLVTLIVAILFLTVLLAVISYIIFNFRQGKRFVHAIMRTLKRFFPDKVGTYEERVDDTLMLFHNTIREIAHDRRKLVLSTALSMAIWGFWILRTYFVFVAFGVTISFTVLAVVAVVSSFMSMVPFSPGGFGTTDGAMIVLFSGFGVVPSIAVGVTLIDRIISYWLSNVMGACTLGLSHREINRTRNITVKL